MFNSLIKKYKKFKYRNHSAESLEDKINQELDIDYSSAIKLCKDAIEMGKSNLNIYLTLSRYYLKEDNHIKLINTMERAIKEEKYDERILNQVLYEYLKKNDKDKSYELYEFALCNKKETIYLFKGIAHLNFGNNKKIKKVYHEAINRNKADQEILFNLGNIYYNENNKKEAVELYEKAIELDFDKDIGVSLFIILTSIYEEEQKHERSINIIQDLINKKIYEPILVDKLISLKKDKKERIKISKDAFENNCFSIDSAINIIKKYYIDKNYEKATEILLKSYEYNINRKIKEENINYDYYKKLIKYYNEQIYYLNTYIGYSYIMDKKNTIAKKYLMENYNDKKICNKGIGYLINIFSKELNYDKVKELYQYAKDNNKDSPYVHLKMFHNNFIDKNEYHKILIEKTKQGDYIYEALYNLYQQTLNEEFIDGKDTSFFLKKIIDYFITNDSLKNTVDNKECLESKIKILIDKEDNPTRIILKEENNKEKIEGEIKNLKMIKKLMKDEADIPVITEPFEYNNKFYYSMSLENAMTLTELINYKQIFFKDYFNAIKSLAKIHIFMPREQEKYNFREKLPIYVNNSGIEEEIIDEMNIILPILENSKLWGFSKDGFTDNWLFSNKDKPIIIDAEDKNIVPYALDLSSLINFIPAYDNIKDRVELANMYISIIEQIIPLEEKYKINKNKFIKEYIVATVFRSIEKSGYFKTIDRFEDSKEALNTGIKTIDYIFSNGLGFDNKEIIALSNIRNLLNTKYESYTI
jgi:hypothetical protein